MKGRHPFHTLASSKFEWKLLPTAAALGSVGRRVCGTQHGLARTPRYEIADNNLGLPQQSSSNVAGNEILPKRENELKDWIISPWCL